MPILKGATPKSIQIGNTVLLKEEKSSKLSTNFHPSETKTVPRGSWTEGKRCPANNERSVWKQPSVSSEFAKKGRRN